MEVIGAGFGRTGTMSLKVALERLGFAPCYHMTEVFAHPEHAGFWVSAWRGEPVDWEGVLGNYEAAVDWPACTFYEELLERNPEARVILSVRDPEGWYESVRNTLYELSVVVPRHPLYRIGYKLVSLLVFRGPGNVNLAKEIIWQGTFDGRFEDKGYAIEVFSGTTKGSGNAFPGTGSSSTRSRKVGDPCASSSGSKSQTNHSPALTTRHRCVEG